METAQRAGAAAVPHDRAAWQTVTAGLLGLAVAMGIGRFAFTPILPAMRDAFGLTPAALGTLASANYLGYLLGAIAAAVPIPSRTRGWLLRGSLLAVVATTALMAATANAGFWLTLRFLAGLASAGVFVFGSAAVLGWLQRHGRLDLTGWFFSGVGFGIVGSGLVILAVQRMPQTGSGGAGESWRAEWLAVTLLAVLLTLPCWAWLPRESRGGVATNATPSGSAAGRVPLSILLLGVAYFLDGAGYIVAGTFLVAIVSAIPGLAGLGAGAWVLVGLAGAPSAVLWSKLGRRIGLIAALGLAYAGQALSLALPALSGAPLAAAFSAILFGGTFIAITLLTIAEGRRRVPPHLAARTIGLLTASFGLGQVLGPLAAARLAGEQADFRPALLVASGAVLLGALLIGFTAMLPDPSPALVGVEAGDG